VSFAHLSAPTGFAPAHDIPAAGGQARGARSPDPPSPRINIFEFLMLLLRPYVSLITPHAGAIKADITSVGCSSLFSVRAMLQEHIRAGF